MIPPGGGVADEELTINRYYAGLTMTGWIEVTVISQQRHSNDRMDRKNPSGDNLHMIGCPAS